MRRFRFYVPRPDGRPLGGPTEGPYWITDVNAVRVIVVAYSPDLETLTGPERWPDAKDIEDGGEQEIAFTSRFPAPEWWTQLQEERTDDADD